MRHLITLFSVVLLGSIESGSLQAQTVTDIERNVYKTVTISKQVWFAENLRTTKYRNGNLINTTSYTKQDIRNEAKPTYQWPSNAVDKNIETYGRLYTWYAVTDSRGICPVGWHVSTDAEWSELVTFLGGDVAAYTRLKEMGNDHWLKYDSGSNETGFTALPGGIRNYNGIFEDFGSIGNWWTSTEYDNSSAWCRSMNSNQNTINRFLYLKRNGLSVRCVKTID